MRLRTRAVAPALIIAVASQAACHGAERAEREAGSLSDEDGGLEGDDDAGAEGDAGEALDAGRSSEGGTAPTRDSGSVDAGPQVQVNSAARATLSVRDPLQVCLLDAQGALACRGPSDALHVIQTGPFVDYAMNERGDGCGLRADGTLRCWGGTANSGALCATGDADCANGGLPPSTQSYQQVAIGAQHACGLGKDGTILCWGRAGANKLTTPPSGSDFIALESDEDVSCALTRAGEAKCWGDTFGYFGTLEHGASLTMGGDSVCTMSSEGAVSCLRWDSGALPSDRTLKYARISMSMRVLCALTAQGKAQCFGAGSITRVAPLPGPFVQIANSDSYACGQRADGTVECWGDAWGNGAGDETCKLYGAELTINGMARSFGNTSRWEGTNASYATTGSWRFDTSFGTGNYVSIAGVGTYSGDPAQGPIALFPSDSAVPVSSSYWLLDATDQRLGALTCSGAGSTLTRHGDELRFDLKKLATLSCPGRPVAGSISFCENEPCPSGAASGSIHGTPWTAHAYSYGYTGGRGEELLTDGSLLVVSREPGFDNASNALIWGLLITAADGPFKGEVLCVGSGTVSGPTFMKGWQLGDFSLLDPCPTSGTGTLSGCMR